MFWLSGILLKLAVVAPSTLLTSIGSRLIVSPEASKHVSDFNLNSGHARSAVYQQMSAQTIQSNLFFHSKLNIPIPNDPIVTFLVSLDVGLGIKYEETVAAQVTRKLIAQCSRKDRHLIRQGVTIPLGSATIKWTGDRRVASLAYSAFLNHSSVVAVEFVIEFKTSKFASERILRPGASVEGLHPNLGVPAPGSLAAYGYTGTGQTVCVADTGLWVGHCRYSSMGSGAVSMQSFALQDSHSSSCLHLSGSVGTRVTYVSYSCPGGGNCQNHVTDFHAEPLDHGTHVASLVFNSAPDINLVSLDLQHSVSHSSSAIIPPPNMYAELLDMPYTCHGARIFSFSWAGSYAGAYSNMDRTMDHFTWDHDDAVILSAAGNEGVNGLGSVGSPSTAKNVISVGAVLASREFFSAAHGDSINYSHFWKGSMAIRLENPALTGTSGGVFDLAREMGNVARDTMVWSSRGPCADGRRKPDVSAVGSYVIGDHATGQSADVAGSCDVVHTNNSMQGTSMATPVLAGAAAILAQLFDACSLDSGCMVNASTLGSMHQGGWGNSYRVGKASSSLIKAVLAAASSSTTGQANYLRYWSNGHYKYRPYRSIDSNSLIAAEFGSGFGEVMVGRLIVPTTVTPYRHTYVYGESQTRKFISMTAQQALSTSANSLSLASVFWSGDNAHHSHCYRTLQDNAVFTAVLAWRDYPSHPVCNPCLQTDLALTVLTVKDSFGGSGADTINNLEKINLHIPAAGTLVKVLVHAVYVSNAIASQKYSVVVSGDIAEVNNAGQCGSCAFQTERVPCVDNQGYGDIACTTNVSSSTTCEFYTTCYAKTSSGVTLVGTSSTDCLPGQTSCLGIMFPAMDRTQCQTFDCPERPSIVFHHGVGSHTCPQRMKHVCINYTDPATGLVSRVYTNRCESDIVEVDTSIDDISASLVWNAALAMGVSLTLFGFIICTIESCQS